MIIFLGQPEGSWEKVEAFRGTLQALKMNLGVGELKESVYPFWDMSEECV